MLETIIAICSLYTGSPAAQCRVHIRHCVEDKYKARDRRQKIKMEAEQKYTDSICATKLGDLHYCHQDRAGTYLVSTYYTDAEVDTTERDFIEECAKKEGVI